MNELQKISPKKLSNGTVSDTDVILRSKSPSFLTLQNQGQELRIKKIIALMTGVFIKASYPATDITFVSKEFAKELFQRKDWKLKDVKRFFEYIKENATNSEFKVLGNSIGLMHLLKYVTFYENQRSAARESYIAKYKDGENQKYAPEVKQYIEKVLKTIRDNAPKREPRPIGQKLFDPIANEKDYESFLKLIPDIKKDKEETKKIRLQIFNYRSIIPIEMERRFDLLYELNH